MSDLSLISENIEEEISIKEEQFEGENDEEKEISTLAPENTVGEGHYLNIMMEDTSDTKPNSKDSSTEITTCNVLNDEKKVDGNKHQINEAPRDIIRQAIIQQAIEKFSNVEAEKIIQEALLIKHFLDEDNSHFKTPRKPLIDKLPNERVNNEGYDRYLLEKLLHSEPDPNEETFEGFESESLGRDDVYRSEIVGDGANEINEHDFDTSTPREHAKEKTASSQSILHKEFDVADAFGENALQTIDEDKELDFHEDSASESNIADEEDRVKDLKMDEEPTELEADAHREEMDNEQLVGEDILEADIQAESSEDEEEDIGEMTYKQKKAVVAAVRIGNIDLLEDLLDKRHADMNMLWYNENLLMVAIRAEQEIMAEFLVDNGVDVNHTSALIERTDKGEITVYPQTCREMAFDRNMTDLVELIDFKTNNLFNFVHPKERNIRIRRPRPPTPPTPEEESEDDFTDEDGSQKQDLSGATEDHVLTEAKLRKFERDLDSGLNSSNNAENERKPSVIKNDVGLTETNSQSGNNTHRESVADSSHVSQVFGKDEGYETMSPVSPVCAPPPPRLEHNIVGTKEHVSIRGTRASHSAKMHNFKTITNMLHGQSDNTPMHRLSTPGSYSRESRRWHQTKSAPAMRSRQSFESIPELVRTGVPFVHGDKRHTQNNSNVKNCSTVISPYSQVAKLLAGSRLLKPHSASSLPSISHDRTKRSDSLPIRTETQYIYAERNSANLHERISFLHQPRVSTAGSGMNRPRQVR